MTIPHQTVPLPLEPLSDFSAMSQPLITLFRLLCNVSAVSPQRHSPKPHTQTKVMNPHPLDFFLGITFRGDLEIRNQLSIKKTNAQQVPDALL